MKVWEWIDTVEPGYVVLRFVVEGADDQLCVYENGLVELRGYDEFEEEDCWKELHV